MTVIGIPFVWLLLFLVFPFAIVFKISFAEMAVAIPPFTELFAFAEEKLSVILNLGNYLFLIEDHLYLSLIHISEPTRPFTQSRMPSSA